MATGSRADDRRRGRRVCVKGGFAVPFNAVQVTTKDNNKWYLVMNATKDALKSAKGFKYDRNAMTWIPEDVPATTGTPANPLQR
ncbi:MAG: hypothetical protein ACXU89_01165 [Xanthobacteraceae bacterium]